MKNASFSLALVTPFDDEAGADGGRPIWEYHHLAEANERGTKKIDGDSQYLIGSISKLISDLLLLRSDINVDEPITKFLPQLKSDSSPIRWNNITLSALGQHLGGIPANCTYLEQSLI